MKIVLTKHAIEKIERFRKNKIIITKENILKVINNPEHVDRNSDKPKIITSKTLNERLVLRVVYKEEGDIIKVITFYPAKKGRYYESN